MVEKICPLMGGACVKEGCMWWVHVKGKTPQEEKEVDLGDCAVSWGPVLLLEMTKAVREADATVGAFRGESLKANEGLLGLIFKAVNRSLSVDAGISVKKD